MRGYRPSRFPCPQRRQAIPPSAPQPRKSPVGPGAGSTGPLARAGSSAGRNCRPSPGPPEVSRIPYAVRCANGRKRGGRRRHRRLDAAGRGATPAARGRLPGVDPVVGSEELPPAGAGKTASQRAACSRSASYPRGRGDDLSRPPAPPPAPPAPLAPDRRSRRRGRLRTSGRPSERAPHSRRPGSPMRDSPTRVSLMGTREQHLAACSGTRARWWPEGGLAAWKPGESHRGAV